MKTKILLSCLFCVLVSTSVFSQSIRICGYYKLTGYFEDGTPYSGTLSVKKTDDGLVMSSPISSYLKEFNLSGASGNSVTYMNKNHLRVTFRTNGTVSIEGLTVLGKDIFGKYAAKKIMEAKATRKYN